MPILKKKGRAPGAFRTLAKALMHKTVLVPSEAIPEPALTKGKDFVEGKVRVSKPPWAGWKLTQAYARSSILRLSWLTGAYAAVCGTEQGKGVLWEQGRAQAPHVSLSSWSPQRVRPQQGYADQVTRCSQPTIWSSRARPRLKQCPRAWFLAMQGIDKSHYNSLHVKFEGDARKFYFPADCVNQWLVDGTVHLSLPGSSSKEEDARTAADDDEDNTASEELPDAAGIESESTPAPQAGPVPPPDAAAPLGDAARQLSAGNGPAAPLPQASQRAGTASGPDVPQPTVSQQPHEAAHTAAKPAAVAPSTSRQGDEPGFREPTPSAPHPAQPAPSAPKEAPTQPQQPPNGVPQGSQAGKGDQAAGPPNLAAPAATAQVSSRPAAPQLPVVTSAGVWVFAPLPNGGVKPISGPGLTGRFFHKFLYPPSGAAGPSQQGAAAGPSQAPSQGPAQPASSKGEPAGGLQPRLSSCQMQHRKSRLGTETKSGDRQWVADVHVPVEGGVQKRTAPAAPSKAIQQGAGRLLILKQQMRKWKKPSKGVTKRSAVVDIVNKVSVRSTHYSIDFCGGMSSITHEQTVCSCAHRRCV